MSKTAREVIANVLCPLENAYFGENGLERYISAKLRYADSILRALKEAGYIVVLDDYEELEQLAEKKLLAAADGE